MKRTFGFAAAAMLLLASAPAAVQQARQPPAGRYDSQPGLSLDALDTLRDRARRTRGAGRFNPALARLLELGDGPVTTRQLSAVRPEGKYYVCFTLPWENDEIIFALEGSTRLDVYRSESGFTLRRAAVRDAAGLRAVSFTDAVAGFRKMLEKWEELSAARGAAAATGDTQCAGR